LEGEVYLMTGIIQHVAKKEDTMGWKAYESIDIDIARIVKYIGQMRGAAIYFLDRAGDSYKLYFRSFDLRYTTKAAFGDTLARIPKELFDAASMFVGTESGYLKRFEHEVCGTIPLDDIRHYALFDDAGYGVETLGFSEPVLTKLGYDLNDYAYPKFKLGTAGQRGRGNCPTYLGE
jgi:hypothetical protein